MPWLVVHTKPKGEQIALLNLSRQGYTSYLPLMANEVVQRNRLAIVQVPLFPRYLFVHTDDDPNTKSWAPIRYTLGVSNLVTFGNDAARVDNSIIEAIRATEQRWLGQTQCKFTPGEHVTIQGGPFANIDAIYQMADGDRRVFVLIEMLSKPVKLSVTPNQLRKAATLTIGSPA